MDLAGDIRRLALQEERLQFSTFDTRTAWEVGLALKSIAGAHGAPVVVDIRLYSMRLLSFAEPGAKPENFDWARRKRNIVFRMHRSSYAVGRKLVLEGKTLDDLGALPERDYAAHGGSFPILLTGTGCVGAVTVSGLPQRDDHRIVVDALSQVLGRDIRDIALE